MVIAKLPNGSVSYSKAATATQATPDPSGGFTYPRLWANRGWAGRPSCLAEKARKLTTDATDEHERKCHGGNGAILFGIGEPIMTSNVVPNIAHKRALTGVPRKGHVRKPEFDV
jgi:hypothetical protein